MHTEVGLKVIHDWLHAAHARVQELNPTDGTYYIVQLLPVTGSVKSNVSKSRKKSGHRFPRRHCLNPVEVASLNVL